MTKQEKARLAQQIRRAIESSKLTRYALAKRSGVGQSSLSRFVNGKGALSFDSIEKIASVLGLGLAIITKKERRRR